MIGRCVRRPLAGLARPRLGLPASRTVPPSASSFRRHFLPWDGPWLPQVAAWLAHGWAGPGPLDLSRVLAVVPTRQAGRRLREALAEHAAARGSAVFPPRTHTPDTLLAAGVATPEVASRLEALLAWAAVLREVDLAAVPDVLPIAPPRRDFPWAWRLAESLSRLQTQLAEGGLGLADVAPRAGDAFPEAERWRQLAGLERAQIEKLATLGRREPHAARRTGARESAPPEGIDRVVVLGAPDPLPLALDLLRRWAGAVPVEIVIHAPATEAAAFDDAGRPLAAAWSTRVLVRADFERHVHLCIDPAAEAERVAAFARGYAQPDGRLAIGVADAEVVPPLENELSRAAIASYNPEGRGRRGEGLHALLTALAALARDPTGDVVATLARCPDFLAALRGRFGEGFATTRFLAELDEVRARHLPANLTAWRRAVTAKEAHLARALGLIEDLQATLAHGAFPDHAIAALNELFRDRRFDLARPEDARAAGGVAAWREVMRECAAAAELFPETPPGEWWDVALRMFGEGRRTEEKAAGALELQGWLELLWEDAPHLVVAGLNDGLVPEAVVGDAFLPESLRERLGLKTNAARFARDAYLLQAIAASRQAGSTGSRQAAGRLDLLFAKTSAAGDPLRPSRLLLRCDDAELPRRVAFLFRAVEATRPNRPWTRTWKLAPRRTAPPARVPVTGLRAWLACPFRFYLQHVLRMEAVDPAKDELDARDFGTLCHTALEAMAREPALRDCTDEAVLREFLLGELERVARTRFGDELTLPLIVQLESARQRLARAAAVQAREQAAGWRIERVEWAFALDLGGLEVRGKIDRVDRHGPTGACRVIDYKTSDLASPPQKSHLRPRRAGDELRPAWAGVTLHGRDHVWADLQLPLYLRAIGREPDGAASLTCGYFNLPKAAGETALAPWPELGGELLASAAACADGVAAAIRAGEFWPPAEDATGRDAFAMLFHHGTAESVAWEVKR